ncbi:hypothetical protein [Bryocella elongata]|uniref:hypothetical protein n=1 Tax=Bryocella elongata TaxID=863522 RepID=UPI0011B0D268|nr:hypothetical protein [Bryocella elongata]
MTRDPGAIVSIPGNIQILAPWRSLEEDRPRADLLSAQLLSDISPSHPLCGAELRAVGARTDRDDVLFEITGGDAPLAVVHMTWRKESDPRWPTTKFYQSWEQWSQE